jgi:hypothetical protein
MDALFGNSQMLADLMLEYIPNSDMLSDSINSLNGYCDNFQTHHSSYIESIRGFAKTQSSILSVASKLAEAIKNIPYDESLQYSIDSECQDYVVCPKDIVSSTNSEIIEIPENLYIPVGKNLIKIKTELFVNIVVILISGVFAVVGTLISMAENQNAKAIEQSRIELTAEILDTLKSIDHSHSSQSEVLEALAEQLQESLTEEHSDVEYPHNTSE